MPLHSTVSCAHVVKAAQLNEFGMFARWAASRFQLTEIQRRAIENEIDGVRDQELADEYGVSRSAIHQARQMGLRKLRQGLEAVGIDRVGAVI